jgi:hypothetical protein
MNKWLPATVLVISAIVGLMSLSLLTEAPTSVALEPSPTPPPPTWTTGPPAAKTPLPPPSTGRSVEGGKLQLVVSFGEIWPWPQVHWQQLWTVVQWQDPQGEWHVVEGWQGQLDHVSVEESGEIEATRTWWVGEGDLGKGPFRWLVYREQDGRLLRAGAPFYLPDRAGWTTEVSLTFEAR